MNYLPETLSKGITSVFLFIAISSLFISANCNSSEPKRKIDDYAGTTKDSTNYLNYCAGCHGFKMEEFQNRNWMFAKSDEEIINIIKNGEKDMGMPAFSQTFSDEEIKSLSKYVISESAKFAQLPTSSTFGADNNKEGKVWAETIVTDLDIPWGLEFLPNGELLISERSGKLLKYTKEKETIEIKGFPEVRAKGQGGLMDIKLHPNYKENGWIYFSYSYIDESDNKKANTAIIRAKLKDDQLYDIETIYKAVPTSTKKHHYGSRFAFDKEGYLYFSVGDRGNRDRNPQTLDNSNGKIHRLHDDGTIPEDNPFVNEAGAIKSIYSYGHRNPQGVTMNPVSGDIWIHEHGPKGGDEINIIKKGVNYGWPVVSYGINYDGTSFTELTEKEGMEDPILFYVPSIAPCGMAWITSDKYPGWENSLLIGSLKFLYVERCTVEGDKIMKQEKLVEGIGRVRNVVVSPDGYIYVAVEAPGKIIKLVPADEK